MMGATISSPYKGEVGSQCEPGGAGSTLPFQGREFAPTGSGHEVHARLAEGASRHEGFR
jgi:hypothetical protein